MMSLRAEIPWTVLLSRQRSSSRAAAVILKVQVCDFEGVFHLLVLLAEHVSKEMCFWLREKVLKFFFSDHQPDYDYVLKTKDESRCCFNDRSS